MIYCDGFFYVFRARTETALFIRFVALSCEENSFSYVRNLYCQQDLPLPRFIFALAYSMRREKGPLFMPLTPPLLNSLISHPGVGRKGSSL